MKVIVVDRTDVIEYPETCPSCGSSVFAEPSPPPDSTKIEFVASADEGNRDGVYDGAYSFGIEGELRGTPRQIGDAVARYLARLSRDDIERMKLGTDRFFLRLTIEPRA